MDTTTATITCDACDATVPADEAHPAGGEGTSVPEGTFCEACLGH